MRADAGQNRNDRERNTGSDKAVLDGRGSRFVLQESNEIPTHHGTKGPELGQHPNFP